MTFWLHRLHAVRRCSPLLHMSHIARDICSKGPHVCLCVAHTGELCKNGSTNMRFEGQTRADPRNLVLDEGSHPIQPTLDMLDPF